MAIVNVLPEYDMHKIAQLAEQHDPTKLYCIAGAQCQLVVADVEQETLDAALATYVSQHDALYLEKVKTLAKQMVDETAEEVRLTYITGGAGQALVYNQKAKEADDYIADGAPENLAMYPFIQAEVDATGKTASQCALDILAQRDQWVQVGAQIERIRIAKKAEITSASDVSSVNSLKDTAIDALQQL